MPKKLPLQRGKSYNKIDHERGKSSHSIECLDSCMLSHNLKEKWKTIGSPIAFAGISKIYNYYNKQISKKEIEHILSTFPTYTKYKEAKKIKIYNPFLLYYKHQQWQLDLIYISNLREWNDDISYLLVVMECFSRKIFVTPLKTKSTTETVNSFTSVHLYIGCSPNSIYLDKGCEFNSHTFRNYCENHNIRLIFSTSNNKASLVERSQRTLQGIMYKFMNLSHTNRYIDKLDAIVKTYNSKVNRTIKMSPNEAYEDANYNIVMKNHELRYTKALNNRRKPKYKLGDMVRIYTLTKGGGSFRKGYKPAFSNEVFSIYKVDTRLPIPRYYLSDSKNEKIEGSFQAHELSIERR